MGKKIVYIIIRVLVGLFVIAGFTPVNVEAGENKNIEESSEEKLYGNTEEDFEDKFKEYDFSKIDKIIDDSCYADNKEIPGFGETVKKIFKGDSKGVFLNVFKLAWDRLFYEINYNKSSIVKIMLFVVGAALIKNLSDSFTQRRIPEISFFAIYSFELLILINAYGICSKMVENILSTLLEFMRALIPAFFLSVGVSRGVTVSAALYEFSLITISIVEYIILKTVLPAVNIYMVVMFIDNILEKNYLSGLGKVIGGGVNWCIKMIPSVAVSINIIGSIVLPSVESGKSLGIRKIFSAIPGVGNSVDAFSEIISGSAMAIKNVIGAAALIFIIIIVVFPMIKLLVVCGMYKVTAAVVQPVSDKRIINLVSLMGDGVQLLYRTVLSCGLLFFLSIAIICMGTGI